MNTRDRDWKLLLERIPVWKDAYFCRCVRSYQEMLMGEGAAEVRVRDLQKKMNEDGKEIYAVLNNLRKKDMELGLCRLYGLKVIGEEDLQDFSDELKSALQRYFD